MLNNIRFSPPARVAMPAALQQAIWALCAIAIAFTVASGQALAQPVERPDSFADLAERLLPSVVNISTSQVVEGRGRAPAPEFPPGSPFEDFFDRFGDDNQPNGAPRRATALGSGFIIDADGIVVTNNHVIEGADEITVILQDDREFQAELIGTDPETDVAVLRVHTDEELPAVSWGDSDSLRVGDWVLAIGNPYGLGGTVTAGIVSARGRNINAGRYDDFIQTDAAINRGNSGGPMFNLDGEVVGINTAIFSPTGASVGIGFSVPAAMARSVVDQLIEFGRTRRGWIGVRIQTVTDEIAESLGMDEARGALVAGVTPGGPSAEAGIEPGDVIVGFDGRDVPEMRDLPRIVAETSVGSSVPLTIFRNGETIGVEITLGELEVAQEQGLLDGDGGGSADADDGRELAELGLTLRSVTPGLREEFGIPSDSEGVVITEVAPDSPAAEEGLLPGELVVEVGQEPVDSPGAVVDRINAAREQGRRAVLLLIERDGQLRFVALTLNGG